MQRGPSYCAKLALSDEAIARMDAPIGLIPSTRDPATLALIYPRASRGALSCKIRSSQDERADVTSDSPAVVCDHPAAIYTGSRVRALHQTRPWPRPVAWDFYIVQLPLSVSVLAANCAPLKPIDIPLAAEDCQLCADVPGTQVAVRRPTVGVA